MHGRQRGLEEARRDDLVRRRLQPRAVAAGGVGRGRAAHAARRRQPRHRRRVLVGAPRAAPGGVRLRLARRRARHSCTRAGSASTSPRPPRRRRPWLAVRHPETLPVTESGVRLAVGSRQQYCPSSPVYRERARELVTRLVERYAGHPALELWHVNNEYGCHVSHCYCDVSAAAFREWLAAKYGSIEELNRAWGTAFWSQRYDAFEEVMPPRAAPTFRNPTQLLDFDRFSSDELLACYRAEVEVIRPRSSVPITTNFMGFFKAVDYWTWAPRGRRRLGRHLPRPGRPRLARVRGDGARPHAIARRRCAVDPHGAVAERRELARAERGEGAGADAGVVVPGGRPRRRRRAVLPVAPVRGRVGEVPLGPRAARRNRHARLARGGAARRRAPGALGAGRRGRRRGDAGAVERRDRPRLGQLVGDRAAGLADDGPVPRGAVRLAPRPDLARRRGRLRPRAVRPLGLPRRGGTGALRHDRRAGREPRRLRRSGRHARRRLRHRDHRRAPARPARRIPRRAAPGDAGRVDRGVRAAGRARPACGGRRGRPAGRTAGRPGRRGRDRRPCGPRSCAWTMPTRSCGSARAPSTGCRRSRRRSTGEGSGWYVATLPEPDALRRLAARVAGRRRASKSRRPRRTARTSRSCAAASVVFVINHGADDAEVLVDGTDLLTGHPSRGSVLPSQGVAIIGGTGRRG